MLSSAQLVTGQKKGTALKTGTMTGTETADGYDLAATDFLTEARIRRARPKERPISCAMVGASTFLSPRQMLSSGGFAM